MEFLINIYGLYGFLALGVSMLAWALSHIFFVKELKELDFLIRIIGFIAFISIFIISGWKSGLISIPIILGASFLGAIIANRIKGK